MNPTTTEHIARMSGGRLATGDGAVVCRGVHFDSRKISVGDVFVALVSDRDGHDFVDAALANGASACLISREDVVGKLTDAGVVGILVEDTLSAFQKWSAAYRAELNPKVIAVTGSNGKTSTKDLIRSVLSQRFTVAATAGNFNNHIGVPMTLLSLSGDETHLITEIGMNHPGEIAPLAELAAPDIAVVTNIGVAHIEFMKTQDAIAAEKGSLLAALGSDGLAVINANDEFADALAGMTQVRVMRAGIDGGDVSATDLEGLGNATRFTIKTSSGQQATVTLPLPGRHMVNNAVIAATVGMSCGLSLDEVVKGLENVQLSGGRMTSLQIGGITAIDDTYNANPDSMSAAVDVLASWPNAKRRIAVLGEMGELGDHAEDGYRKVGARLASSCIDQIVLVGPATKTIGEAAGEMIFTCFDTTESAAAELSKNFFNDGDVVLFKGSRTSRIEIILQALRP